MIISQYISDKSSLFVRVYDLNFSYTRTESNNFNIININQISYTDSALIDKNIYIEITNEPNYVLPVSS